MSAARPLMSDTIDASLGALPLIDEAGQPHALQELWAGGPAVIVFLRHFG